MSEALKYLKRTRKKEAVLDKQIKELQDKKHKMLERMDKKFGLTWDESNVLEIFEVVYPKTVSYCDLECSGLYNVMVWSKEVHKKAVRPAVNKLLKAGIVVRIKPGVFKLAEEEL